MPDFRLDNQIRDNLAAIQDAYLTDSHDLYLGNNSPGLVNPPELE